MKKTGRKINFKVVRYIHNLLPDNFTDSHQNIMEQQEFGC